LVHAYVRRIHCVPVHYLHSCRGRRKIHQKIQAQDPEDPRRRMKESSSSLSQKSSFQKSPSNIQTIMQTNNDEISKEEPAQLHRYHMPPEWHQHSACLILYPHNTGVFRSLPSETCGPARREVRNVARAIRDFGNENVFIFCNTDEDAQRLLHVLKEEDNIIENEIHVGDGSKRKEKSNHEIFVKVCKSDDSWCRDTGPTFVKRFVQSQSSSSIIGLDWKFNAYGGPVEGCYWPCENDQEVARNMIEMLSQHYSTTTITTEKHVKAPLIICEQVDLVLEGGSFHTDGEGTILTTKECLLNPNRNPDLTMEQIENVILKHLGGTKVIWLPFGIHNDDDTNGHVDNIATFARPSEVVLSWTDDEHDENYKRCRAAEEVLLEELDAQGRKITIHRLHLPSPMYYSTSEVNTLKCKTEKNGISHKHGDNGLDEVDACERVVGERLAASYVNYYLANDAIILPQFGDEKYDYLAKETMSRIFHDKKVACVYSREILLGGGNIHCVTQQVPKIS